VRPFSLSCRAWWGCTMDDKTYYLRLPCVVEAALRPIRAFKELLIGMDEPGMTVDPDLLP